MVAEKGWFMGVIMFLICESDHEEVTCS